MKNPRYAPEFDVSIDGAPIPAALRSSITALSHQSGLEGADRVELSLANENLRWLDEPLLALDKSLELSMGYAPDPLTQVFSGMITGQSATFPSGSAPALTVTAQDRLHALQKGDATRWFALPTPMGNVPLPDVAVGAVVTATHLLVPIFEPVGAALSILLGGASAAASLGDPIAMQKLIRKQAGESDFDLLHRLAQENGWEMTIDHATPPRGYTVRFMSPLDKLSSDLTLIYGLDLIDFTPRVSSVGQVAGVSATIWVPEILMEFTVTLGYDWDRNALTLSVLPGFGLSSLVEGAVEAVATAAGITAASLNLIEEPVTLVSAPRLILSRLIPMLNERLTGSGSSVGDPRIQGGTVLRLEGVGETFGGLYRVVSATHALDSGGYRTSFELRKEIWFGSIPPADQGAVAIQGRSVPIGA